MENTVLQFSTHQEIIGSRITTNSKSHCIGTSNFSSKISQISNINYNLNHIIAKWDGDVY